MIDQSQLFWFVDETQVSASSTTRRRIDTYELGLAAAAAIELEEEFPGMAVSARLHLAESQRTRRLAAA